MCASVLGLYNKVYFILPWLLGKRAFILTRSNRGVLSEGFHVWMLQTDEDLVEMSGYGHRCKFANEMELTRTWPQIFRGVLAPLLEYDVKENAFKDTPEPKNCVDCYRVRAVPSMNRKRPRYGEEAAEEGKSTEEGLHTFRI